MCPEIVYEGALGLGPGASEGRAKQWPHVGTPSEKCSLCPVTLCDGTPESISVSPESGCSHAAHLSPLPKCPREQLDGNR